MVLEWHDAWLFIHVVYGVRHVALVAITGVTELVPTHLVKSLQLICWSGICQFHIDGLVQDCSISNVLAMEIPQSCTKPSMSSNKLQELDKNLRVPWFWFSQWPPCNMPIYPVIVACIFGLACKLHDDVIKWKHYLRYWPFVQGIHWLTVNSPHKGQCGRALMFSLICAWINGWVNNREAGDLRRHQAHYDVFVIYREDNDMNDIYQGEFLGKVAFWVINSSIPRAWFNIKMQSYK